MKIGIVKYLALFLWIGLFSSCQQQVQSTDEFLHGSWVYETEDRNFVYETWNKDNQNQYSGYVFAFKDDKLLYEEEMRLVYNGKRWEYYTRVSNQNNGREIKFTQADSSSFTFVNPEHEYPQRISYLKKSNGNLDVWISLMDGSQKAKYSYRPIY